MEMIGLTCVEGFLNCTDIFEMKCTQACKIMNSGCTLWKTVNEKYLVCPLEAEKI